jgi:hypothetical protein
MEGVGSPGGYNFAEGQEYQTTGKVGVVRVDALAVCDVP